MQTGTDRELGKSELFPRFKLVGDFVSLPWPPNGFWAAANFRAAYFAVDGVGGISCGCPRAKQQLGRNAFYEILARGSRAARVLSFPAWRKL